MYSVCNVAIFFVPYLQDDGTCNACPVVASAWDRYRGLLVIVGALAVIVVVVWIGLLLLVRLRGGTLTGGASRMASLGVWGFMTVQVGFIDDQNLPCTRQSNIRTLYACVGRFVFERHG